MQIKKSVLTLAISCGLMALPALAQDTTSPATSPTSPTSSAGSAQTGSSPSTGSAATDQQTPGSSVSSQSGSTTGSDQSGAGSSADSKSVESSVESALQKDSDLAGQDVKAHVSSNQIVLTGNVGSQAQKDKAEQVATQAAGSSYTVKNKIKVSGSSGSMSEKQPK